MVVPTGRQPPSAANPSASDKSVLSTSSKRQQPSSYVSIHHPKGRVNPFKFSLNLVVNVQPMDNNEQQQRSNGNVTSAANGVFEDGEGRTMPLIDNSTPIPKQRATNVKQYPQQSLLNGSGGAVSAYHRDDNYGLSTSFTYPGTTANVGAAHSDSRSSHDSSKNKLPTNRRYENKKALLSCASFKKPRSKCTETALPGFQHFPLPRRLSFDESVRNNDVSEYETMRSDADKTFPLDKTFRNSLGFNDNLCPHADIETNEVGAIEAKSSFSHTSQNSLNDKSDAETAANKEVGAIRTILFDSHFPQDSSNVAFSSFKKPRIKNTGASVTSTPVPLEYKAPVYYHQRQIRVGFIMNGVQTAVNCMVNIRSNDEILYVEPVELLYEGEKIWTRPFRNIVKEMEEKIAADKKNQLK